MKVSQEKTTQVWLAITTSCNYYLFNFLNSLSYIYEALNDYDKAIDYAKKAKTILSTFGEEEHE